MVAFNVFMRYVYITLSALLVLKYFGGVCVSLGYLVETPAHLIDDKNARIAYLWYGGISLFLNATGAAVMLLLTMGVSKKNDEIIALAVFCTLIYLTMDIPIHTFLYLLPHKMTPIMIFNILSTVIAVVVFVMSCVYYGVLRRDKAQKEINS